MSTNGDKILITELPSVKSHLIGVCADTNVIYQSVFGKKDLWIANFISVYRKKT